MKIHIDIRDDIDAVTATKLVHDVILNGRVSRNNTMYCYLTVFHTTYYGDVHVVTRDYRKSDCFVVYKAKGTGQQKPQPLKNTQ